MPAEPARHHLAAWLRKRELDTQATIALARVIVESNLTLEQARQAARSTPAGDPARLRGLPAIGRGVGGAMRGTVPHIDGLR